LMENKPDGRVWQDLWVKCLTMVRHVHVQSQHLLIYDQDVTP
jgi:hypothetical protein